MKQRITVLGTGRMGTALALGFLAQGHPLTVWNRTAAKAEPLRAKGCRLAPALETIFARTRAAGRGDDDLASVFQAMRG